MALSFPDGPIGMEDPSQDRRRFTRLMVHLAGVLTGTDMAGRGFFERTTVVSFDQRGARVRTRFSLAEGAAVELQLPTEKAPKRLRVVWSGEPEGLYAGMVGLELVDPDDTWSRGTLRAQWEGREF
jgi:hypothetical protein